MRYTKKLLLISASVAFSLFVGFAGYGDAPVVPGYEYLRASNAVDESAMGEVLLSELNCISCHAGSGEIASRIAAKPAPDLSAIGERVTPKWLAGYIRDPRGTKPGTTMPDVLHSVGAEERESVADAITHFLIGQSGTSDDSGYQPFRFGAMVKRGGRLFHTIGCVACHAPEGTADNFSIPSVPLPALASKTSVGALTEFLLNPESVRHGGRMPSFYLSDDEAADVAVYLLREQAVGNTNRVQGFEYERYLDVETDEDSDGFFERPAPDFARDNPSFLIPQVVGRIDTLTLNFPEKMRGRHYAIRYNGLLAIAEDGVYTLSLHENEGSGSSVVIDGETVLERGGGRRDGVRDQQTEIALDAGDHDISIGFFRRGDGDQGGAFGVEIQGGAITAATPIGEFVVYEDMLIRPLTEAPFEVDASKAARGGLLFVEAGCASCHALESAPKSGAYAARALDELVIGPVNSFLDGHSVSGAPHYALAEEQNAALHTALSNLDELAAARSARMQAVHTLATYNCFACHNRKDDLGSIGGPGVVRDDFFTVVGGQDTGEEGRVPPTLMGIGGKLKRAALESVLTDNRLHVRANYMTTRMPHFAGELLAGLPDALDAADSLADDLTVPPLSPESISDGLHLVGIEGFSCVSCHDVGDNKGIGISMVNLATAYERLRPGWVRRFLRAPSEFNAGTRMPVYWEGDSVMLEGIGGGTADGQIDALLSYFSLGVSMPVPEGMVVGDSLVLMPKTEPIIFRTFMGGAGARAIAVGYPESVHVAFDASIVRLAKVWRGSFFDAKGTWSGRAGQFLQARGDDVLNMPIGPAFAKLDTVETAWPQVFAQESGFNTGDNGRGRGFRKQGYREIGGEFLGYSLDDARRPTFRYRLGDIEISEQPIPLTRAGGADLNRRFTVTAPTGSRKLYLILFEGEEIEGLGESTWRIDDRVTILLRHGGPVQPFIRSSSGVEQLLLPVKLGSGETASMDVEISW